MLEPISLLILDVDGVLTPGQVAPGPEGDQGKTFSVRDGHAIKLWQRCGGTVALISGRMSPLVTRRAEELGIRHVRQQILDKAKAFHELLSELQIEAAAAAFVGDDLPDVPVMQKAGLGIAVGDAAAATKRAANFVTQSGGGRGAVAEAVEWLLRRQGCWSADRLYTM